MKTNVIKKLTNTSLNLYLREKKILHLKSIYYRINIAVFFRILNVYFLKESFLKIRE